MDDVELTVFVFPAASANTPIATEIAPVPDCVSAIGVKTAVYTVDDDADIDASAPPVAVASPVTKFVDGSDKVNVNVEFSPDFRDEALAEIDTVGAVVSTVTVRPDEVDVIVEPLSTVVERAVTTLSPAVKTPVRHDQTPVVEFAVHALPEFTPATCNCTVEPTGAEPVNVSVVAFVMLSVDEVPESSALTRSGVDTSGTA
jgi:hypothetical protein